MHGIGYWIGTAVGAAIGIAALASILRWAIVKRVVRDPGTAGVVSAVAAYMVAVVLSGFGNANGGPWQPSGIIMYLPGALLVGFLFWRKGDAERTDVI